MIKYFLPTAIFLLIPSQATAWEYTLPIRATAEYQSSTTTESFLESMIKSVAFNEARAHCSSIGYYGIDKKTMEFGTFYVTSIKGGARIEVVYDFRCRKFG